MKQIVWLLTVLIIELTGTDLVVVASKDASLSPLSKQEVERLFLGKERRLPNGKRAILIDNNDNTIYDAFYEAVADKSPSQIRSYWAKQVFSGKAKPPLQKAQSQIVPFLEKNKDAIAYLPSNEVPPTLQILYRLK